MAANAAGKEFVTIVPVGESRPVVRENAFVTVLTVGAIDGAAEVVVRRPRGARLGLGLKFEGGSAAAEKVRRLLVQSCTEDSPAANATAPWGKLIPGDEILAIDGISVSELTRIDCVRRLKDSDETLTLLVRHFETTEERIESITVDETDNVIKPNETIRSTALPPPVPPRKLGKKNSFKDKGLLQTVGEQNGVMDIKQITNENESVMKGQVNGQINLNNKLARKSSFDSHLHRQGKDSIASLKRGSPEEVRRLVRRLSDGKTKPPDADVYIDLLSSEWEKCLALADAESDDTGSSMSTVVDRLSSMGSSVDNSIPSTPVMQTKTIDIQKVLNCIENIDSDILKDITTSNNMREIQKETKYFEKTQLENAFSIISEPVIKKTNSNDKNNNNTRISPKDLHTFKLDGKQESPKEQPKPMPRNGKSERSICDKKPKVIPIPDALPSCMPEPLLTPTKQNCIETWLQRSEAEMNNKLDDGVDDEITPEALPRLIDFVPKPQYKESETPVPLARPNAPPPPPPVAEPREDGSGASLDTIGELDESSEVIDCRITNEPDKETKERKSSYESGFWEDRLQKSDAEDKSLSNDEGLLPTCPRQPPDGVETPSDAVEKQSEPSARMPPRLPPGWPTSRPRMTYKSRSQDARSEASVKDKIAMFSNDNTPSEISEKCGTLPSRNSTSQKKNNSYTTAYADVSSLDRRLTKSQDNLDDVPRSYKRPDALGAIESSVKMTTPRSDKDHQIENKPLFYGSTTTLSSFAQPVFHSRSSSDDSGTSVQRSNLEYLIEQRKKSMSKLRGLVIPETNQSPIVDLPAIKVNDPFNKSFQWSLTQNKHNDEKLQKHSGSKLLNLSEKKWKTELLSNNIPKYSPAFKRKSLQVYTPMSISKESTPERKLFDRPDHLNINKMTPSKPPRLSMDVKKFSDYTTSTLPLKFTQNKSVSNNNTLSDLRNYNNVEIKICTITDIVDSDNDSAMSSTQSSYRSSASSPLNNLDSIESDCSRLSPRGCHLTSYTLVKTDIPTKSSISEKRCEEYVKRNVCRSTSSETNVSLSSSAGSAATSGSQASCSSLESNVTDSEKRKVGKTYSIDTINRRNILASAKCRSGRDIKLNSPVVDTKFSHESNDRSPSPQPKTSDRLSTLTSSVSAMPNKGENRRRNKKLAETDSDSDQEVTLRQRKNEYKNTRLKRNLSGSNKTKQVEQKTPSKIEDVPKAVSDKKVKELKNTGLDNLNNNRTKNVAENKILSKNENILSKQENVLSKRKEDKILTVEPSPKLESAKENIQLTIKTDLKLTTTKTGIKNSTITNSPTKSNELIRVKPRIIKLKRGAGTGVGLILAGGTDCEAKEVTVHRVLADSVADRAGLKRGVRVRSINGQEMTGLTHSQSVAILKEQRAEVLIEIEDETKDQKPIDNIKSDTLKTTINNKINANQNTASGSQVTVVLEKAGGGAGLGFGLDGGRDSPQGDRPLTIKKLFAGGAAARSGRIIVGAELLSAGGLSMDGYTRTQAWAALKALPAGPVALVLKNPLDMANKS